MDDATARLQAIVMILGALAGLALLAFVGWLEWRHRRTKRAHRESSAATEPGDQPTPALPEDDTWSRTAVSVHKRHGPRHRKPLH